MKFSRVFYKKYKDLGAWLREISGERHFQKNLSRVKNKKIEDLNQLEQKIYSQHGEDGILRAIFTKIGTTNKFCVEFGVGDGSECNTRYFIEKQNWDYLHMDSGNYTSPFTDIKKEFITAENINELFTKYQVPREFDLLSIDIDFNDYWVWKAIEGYEPRVVVVEYNASVPVSEAKAVEYDSGGEWDGTNYFGASLLAMAKLAREKGYTLVACDSAGVNAFFVKNAPAQKHFVIKDTSELYRPPRYGVKVEGKYIGHPPGDKTMINV